MTAGNIFQPVKCVFIATYPPRRCGIATFTADLIQNLKALYGNEKNSGEHDRLQVIAVDKAGADYARGPEAVFQIREKHRDDYLRAAEFINLSPVDVVCLQHEYGIFGGEDGSYILSLVRNLRKPLVTTLHTLLDRPSPGQKKTLINICRHSARVVVQAQKAVHLLQHVYGVPPEKIVHIHHGTPDVPFLDSSYYKEQFNAEGRKVILTFGLLGPNKGIEYAVTAMEEVAKECPEVLYIILGQTHPEIKRRTGEQYRRALEKIVAEKKLSKHVVFYDEYVSLDKLVQFLVASDIYITPYINREQIVSGTLAYALACGKAIISTPYWYAEELLSDERGLLVPFNDSGAIARAVLRLLRSEDLCNRIRKAAYQYGRQMIWREAAKAYHKVFKKSLLAYGNVFDLSSRKSDAGRTFLLPKVDLRQLNILTDSTGLFQHALYTVPDRRHGYCTDDNARALMATVMNWRLYRDENIIPLFHQYLSFVIYAFNEQAGRFRNFMTFDRQWLEEEGSEDCHGRAVWALGYTVAYPPTPAVLGLCTRLFKQAIVSTLLFTFPRAWSFSLLGCLYYLQRFGGDTGVYQVAGELSQKLLHLYKRTYTRDWPWFEDTVTYDNARLPQALIAAGKYFKHTEMLEAGLRSLRWLLSIQTDPDGGHLTPIGNKGWYPRGGTKARFDQQPLEAAALIDACYQALAATGQPGWRSAMDRAFKWYLGDNDLKQPLYDVNSGGCFDGLQPGGINPNQGGESTISFLLALHCMHLVQKEGILYREKHAKKADTGSAG